MSDLEQYTLPKAKGRILTNLARLYGIQRKWLGLEPDFMLRKRILKAAVGVEARKYWDWRV
jgi:hypothetical protein